MNNTDVKLDTKLSIEVESKVAETLKMMEAHAKIPMNQMINTALKRFIATHKDYLPKSHGGLPG